LKKALAKLAKSVKVAGFADENAATKTQEQKRSKALQKQHKMRVGLRAMRRKLSG